MAQTLEQASRAELGDIVAELEQKSARFRALLAPGSIQALDRRQLRGLLRSVFATRRRSDAILDGLGEAGLREAIGQLLHGPASTQERFQQFVDTLCGFWGDVRLAGAGPGTPDGSLAENNLCDLASELLHFTEPETRWLWTRWMWDPRAGTGALPLVTQDEYDLHGQGHGETYMKVGVAVAFVRATGEAAGFANFGAGDRRAPEQSGGGSPFGIDVFLACVYAVYMYTTLRLRMTQEFNKVVPQLPELCRRLLGTWKSEDQWR
jgi:hypothetical protein